MIHYHKLSGTSKCKVINHDVLMHNKIFLSIAADMFTKALRHHLNLLETAKVSKGNNNASFTL